MIDIMRMYHVRMYHDTFEIRNMLLTVKQTAQKLGISKQRVHILIKQKKLKAKRIGFIWLVESKHIEKRLNKLAGLKRDK